MRKISLRDNVLKWDLCDEQEDVLVRCQAGDLGVDFVMN
jgi:hypothetical protein